MYFNCLNKNLTPLPKKPCKSFMMIKININTEQDEKRLEILKEACIKINEFIDELTTPPQPLYGRGLGRWGRLL